MAAEKGGSDADLRKSPRAPMLLKVEYGSTTEFINDYTENISGGGVFIATTAEFDLGHEIDFAISFPGLLDPIPCKGVVRWRRAQDTPEEPAGIGVQFLVEQSPGKTALVSLIERLREQGGAPERVVEPVVFRVLLVEDNEVVRDMFRYGIQKLSKRAGFPCAKLEVLEAENGKDAWDHLQQQSVHLVIVDLYMPVMDGGQLIEMIRKDARLKNLPVLVVSSGGREGRLRAIQTGADVYLDKPIKLKQMMETIETLIAIGHSPSRS